MPEPETYDELPLRIGLESVDSSHIAAYGYDAGKQILAVQFKSTGVVFHYASFPLDQALAFGAAESKGRFYAQQIKGKYTGRRMTGPCPACHDEGWIGETCTDCGCDKYTETPWKEQRYGS